MLAITEPNAGEEDRSVCEGKKCAKDDEVVIPFQGQLRCLSTNNAGDCRAHGEEYHEYRGSNDSCPISVDARVEMALSRMD